MYAGAVEAASFIPALQKPECYSHAASDIAVLETHISWVFLAGPYAYKIKKPVDLGFVDFSSLERRRYFCEEEVRLNARLAPQLYVDVVEIRGSPEAPRIGGHGPLLDYAVRMRRFAQEALAKHLLAAGKLTAEQIAALAQRIARFHHNLPPADPDRDYGAPERALAAAFQNFEQIEPLLPNSDAEFALHLLCDWTEREYMQTSRHLAERRAAGMIRECHGDLHLGNIVLIDGTLVPFDCLEFNPHLRWIDVMSEIAFLAMDLFDRGAPRLAWLFLNEYLEACGAYSGLTVLRFFLVYRAMVRAKVHLLRARQQGLEAGEAVRLARAYESYVALALDWTVQRKRVLLLMHGLSGCGKSTVALELAQSLGAIRVRSDVERKRLAGLPPLERSGAPVGEGLYGSASTAATYERLAAVARTVLEAGYSAIVDATFLRQWQRDEMGALSSSVGVPIVIVDVRAPQRLLEARIATRLASATDPSDAGLDVLHHQIATADPIADGECVQVVAVDGSSGVTPDVLDELRRLMDS
ncbi:MAG: bifunctional aminoglycoside phosphotransferase/ATP-binding protein [Burkholderiales bacterium]